MASLKALLVGATALLLAAGPSPGPAYRITAGHVVGRDGGWDYLTLDGANHRLFITRGDRVMVVNPATGAVIATIPDFDRAHGVAFAYDVGKAFATSGGDSAVRSSTSSP